jgi:hypothetical protein
MRLLLLRRRIIATQMLLLLLRCIIATQMRLLSLLLLRCIIATQMLLPLLLLLRCIIATEKRLLLLSLLSPLLLLPPVHFMRSRVGNVVCRDFLCPSGKAPRPPTAYIARTAILPHPSLP